MDQEILDFFEEKEVNGKRVLVAIRPMTKEQARQAFPYRPKSRYSESHFGGNNLADDVCLLLNEQASRCKMCQAPTITRYLQEDTCPDCDGRTHSCLNIDPHSE